ncbi:MAG: hypothetical protein EZS28_044919 [Streblomastix strix]|uniref:Tyr recombinase domain-containing protein n=1 Tax=Streblomastix strix TaxID=222440 RepID=A0A5J4TMC5_9EUKA|nr:MAG: hypothetical protein EZS28_044919 [Streblomastix strix]
MIVKPKYVDIWIIGILFDYQREKGLNRNLTNIELQNKPNSLLMTICSMKPAEIKGMSLKHSVIRKKTYKIDLILQPKTMSGLNAHKLPRTRDQTLCPRATFFDWLKRIDNRHCQSIRYVNYGVLQWNEDITIPAKIGNQVYSNRHSAVTQLVVMSLDEKLLKTYTGHVRNSKSANEYYAFVERLKGNEIATQLSDTQGQGE